MSHPHLSLIETNRQFYGQMKDTTSEAFMTMMNLIYKAPGEKTFNLNDIDCPQKLLEVLELAERYEIPNFKKIATSALETIEKNHLKNEVGQKEMPRKKRKRRHSWPSLDTTREKPVLDHSFLPLLPEKYKIPKKAKKETLPKAPRTQALTALTSNFGW